MPGTLGTCHIGIGYTWTGLLEEHTLAHVGQWRLEWSVSVDTGSAFGGDGMVENVW
jgi:hypothetical protein